MFINYLLIMKKIFATLFTVVLLLVACKKDNDSFIVGTWSVVSAEWVPEVIGFDTPKNLLFSKSYFYSFDSSGVLLRKLSKDDTEPNVYSYVFNGTNLVVNRSSSNLNFIVTQKSNTSMIVRGQEYEYEMVKQ